MAFVVRSEIEIEASREVVWRVLTDVAAWSAWSTWLVWEGGAMTKGEHVNLRLTPPDGGGYAFRPEVLVADAPAHLAWVGRTGIAGVFDGEHHFELEESARGSRLRNSERYAGILSPIMQRLPAMKGAEAGFAAMNDEIRGRAEEIARWRGRPVVLVVGRHAERMSAVRDLLDRGGYAVSGALVDAQVIARMQTDAPEVLVIGGGVEPASRAALTSAFAERRPGRAVVEHFGGPAGLVEAVRRGAREMG
jgi:hypothetical protein